MILERLRSQNIGRRFQDLGNPHQGTFSWIFDNPELVREIERELTTTFPNWLRRGDGIFHIAGKPGSGKSTLMKYLCDHSERGPLLAEWAGDKKLIFAKFFFWRMGLSNEKSLKGLVLGLLYGVLCEEPSLVKVLFPNTRAELVRGPQGLHRMDLVADETEAAFAKLVELSASAGPHPSIKGIRICFFIDGLDEYETNGTNETYGDLVQQLLKWTINSNGNIKICVSSRIQDPFMEDFKSSQRFTLNNLTKRDIARVVRDQLGSRPKFIALIEREVSECEGLVQDILEAAEGVFLFVALLLNSLKKSLEIRTFSIQRLRKQVATTPRDLEEFLERILRGIGEDRDGVDMVLAAVLRSYGALLHPENRDPVHHGFDTMHSGGFNSPEPHSRGEFSLGVFGCFSILVAADMGKEISAQLDIEDLGFDGWFRGNMPDTEVHTAMKETVLSRCCGLLEVSGTWDIKFMHRSVPEVLENYLKKRQFDDYQITLTMAWAFRMDVKLSAAKYKPHWSFIEFVLGGKKDGSASRLVSPRGGSVVSIDTKSAPDTISEASSFSESSDDTRLTRYLRMIRGCNSIMPGMQGLYWLLHRLRQTRLKDGCEQIFEILLSIELVIYSTWGPASTDFRGEEDLKSAEDIKEQQWSLLNLGAYVGHHEFIDWVFRGNRIANYNHRLFAAMRSAVAVFCWDLQGAHGQMVLEVMKTIFDIDTPTNSTFPFGPGRKGDLLWHTLLLHSWSRLRHSPWSEAIKLWLSSGANPQVDFALNENRGGVPTISGIVDVGDGSCRLGFFEVSDSFYSILPLWLRAPGEDMPASISLRKLASLCSPTDKELLDLLDGKICAETDSAVLRSP